jgi:hypothetical protein
MHTNSVESAEEIVQALGGELGEECSITMSLDEDGNLNLFL